MAKRICQKCNGSGNIVVRDPKTGKREVVICPRCHGSGEEDIK